MEPSTENEKPCESKLKSSTVWGERNIRKKLGQKLHPTPRKNQNKTCEIESSLKIKACASKGSVEETTVSQKLHQSEQMI